jgi:hypothetical protein
MNLDDAQRKKVIAWIGEGLKLSEIQNRLSSELGITLTYMDVRLLVDDLKLTPKDPEPPKPATSHLQTPSSQPAPVASPQGKPEDALAAQGKVSVIVDHIARPGALVSGTVTFSDGNKAEWHLDETGRLGLAPKQKGYRPSDTDVQQFQLAMQSELSKLGL